MSKKIPFLFSLGLLWLAAGMPGWGCDTPVHQYAMENWLPDAYILMLFHRGPLDGPLQKMGKDLESLGEKGEANIAFMAVDVAQTTSTPQLAPFVKKYGAGELPRLALIRPQAENPAGVIWDGPPTPDTVAAILDSPARREIARRLIDGKHAAVWALLESGDRKADDAAARELGQSLAQAPKILAETGQLAPPSEDASPAASPTSSTFSVNFSVLRIPRTDPRERFFVLMLELLNPENQEPGQADPTDKADKSDPSGKTAKPMAIPIFGRGRALGALAGENITPDNITGGCAVLAGPCACEIKAQNPGVDMLVAANWMRALEDAPVKAPEIPGLASVKSLDAVMTTSAPAAVAAPAAKDAPADQATNDPPPLSQAALLVSGIGTLLVLVLAAIIFGSVMRRKNRA